MMLLECIAQLERATQRLEKAASEHDLDGVLDAADHWAWCLEQVKRARAANYCEICGLAGAEGDPRLCPECRADLNEAMAEL